MKRKLPFMLAAGCCLLSTSLLGLGASAQSTQAILEQIAALKAYIATAEKGYRIAEDGLHAIRDIKNGEFNLHSIYFASLSVVNPAVRNMPQVSESIASKKIARQLGELDILISLITDGELQMTDGERMRMILAIDREIREQAQFIHFSKPSL